MDNKTVIGPVEPITLPEYAVEVVAARIDTGARTSAIWASEITEEKGVLQFCLFAKGSKFYTGDKIKTREYSRRIVTNSTGHAEERYTVKTLVTLKGRKVFSTFTLANRSKQTYPVLLGRNILRGKFIVDVKLGKPIASREEAA
jgi:hypothetical protein